MTQLIQAIRLAYTAHNGQFDKLDVPYILHPLRVMMMGDNEMEQIVGVLHDTVEDTDVTLDQISARFGIEIASAVEALTRRDGEMYSVFIGRCACNKLAAQVKRYDLIDNMSQARAAGCTPGMTARYKHALAVLA